LEGRRREGGEEGRREGDERRGRAEGRGREGERRGGKGEWRVVWGGREREGERRLCGFAILHFWMRFEW